MPVYNEYIYEPLLENDAVRLVILHPSVDEMASLSCEIIEHKLSASTVYYSAVSYAWGQAEFSQNLEIKYQGDVKYLRITPNLETVLKGLRKRKTKQYLWIDAICCNQDDEAEKARQIPLMGNIYKTAATVHIWLGHETDSTTRILVVLEVLSRVRVVTKWKSQWDMAQRMGNIMKHHFDGNYYEALGAMVDFFEQPWFHRRWIVQEACLAQHGIVHCGSHTVGLDVISRAATRYQYMDMSDYAIGIAANLRHRETDLSMLELLWRFHGSQCAERKDRIAALLSLARDGHDLHLDYTKPWKETFKAFATTIYESSNNDTRLQLLLHLFEFGSIVEANDSSYPSWVPDWSNSRLRRLPYISAPRHVDTSEPYPKSPGHFGQAHITFQNGCLTILEKSPDICSETLAIVSSSATHSVQWTNDLDTQQVGEIIQKLLLCTSRARSEALLTLLKTLSVFRHPDAQRERTSRCLCPFEDVLWEHLSRWCQPQSMVWMQTLESVLHDFCFVELRSLDENSMIRRGYGVGTESIQMNDLVVPLWSSRIEQFESVLLSDTPEASIRLSTMVAVRQRDRDIRHASDEVGLQDEYKIIGPMICVSWSETPSGNECLSDREQNHFADSRPHMYPMRIR